MVILIGGIAAAVLGVIGVVIFWSPFLSILGGAVPVLLILGGLLAIYFGIDELRYPAPKPEPVTEPAVGETTPAEAPKEAEAERAMARYWLFSYSAQNVEVVREKGLIALSKEREETLQEKIQIGDRVVLYAVSPESQFAGIVEVTGAPTRPSEMPFKPHKEGEVWELCREVRTVQIPPADSWVQGSSLLEDLDLLKEAREGGKDLSRSFAAKLRDVPELTSADHDRVAKALGA